MPRLSAEQRKLRWTGVGASEAAAVVDLSPWRSACDVWMSKPTATRPPLTEMEDEEEGAITAADVGHALEPVLLQLYRQQTGNDVLPCSATLRHPYFGCVLATPDGLGEDRGLEIKVVGARMAHHWAEDTLPDYVLTQCAMGMAVTGRPLWDVVALVGGTDFRVISLARDPELEGALLEGVEGFWTDYVIGDCPPPWRDVAEHKRYLAKRYPGGEKTPCVELTGPAGEDVAEQIRWLLAVKDEIATREEAKAQIEAALVATIGDAYGLAGPWGKYILPKIQGRVDWKAVAEELSAAPPVAPQFFGYGLDVETLAGGAVPAEIMERHRGGSYRRPGYYPPSKPRAQSKGRGRP